ncbi:MAG: SDR family NAD(P)-dependent oxidoreductase [Clostridiales bacterium]|nr:SDR family NAD(P)-dependent oxidoreductase [Clostridiales bacterium]
MKNYFDLSGQVAVVTGASTGLGVQMANALANQGANIVCLARRKEKVDANAAEIAEKYGVKAIGVKCDITDTAAVEAAIDEVLEKREYEKKSVKV